MYGVLNDFVHQFRLFSIPQPDSPISPIDWDNKILKDLVVQVFAHQDGVILVARQQDLFSLLGDDHGERKTEDNDDDEAGPGKEFYQAELFTL